MFFNFQITLSTVLWFDLAAWVQLYVALLQATVKVVPDTKYQIQVQCDSPAEKIIFVSHFFTSEIALL